LEPQSAASQPTTNHAREFKTQKGMIQALGRRGEKETAGWLEHINNAKVHPETDIVGSGAEVYRAGSCRLTVIQLNDGPACLRQRAQK
jgi:hypothetical protein